jgi:hypothetical protein
MRKRRMLSHRDEYHGERCNANYKGGGMRTFLLGALVGFAIAGGAALTKQATATPDAQSTLYSDFCIYRIEDVSYWLNLSYGSAKMITAVAGNWHGWITEYQARNAVGAFGCQRFY